MHFLQGQNSPNFVAGGWKGGEFSFVCMHLRCDSVLKRDYIITIVASEPSAFLHWLEYSGLSDPDKDGAFQQFSKQEAQTYSHTSLQSNTSTASVSSTETRTKKKEAILSSSHLTSDYGLTNIGQTHHSCSNGWSFPFFQKKKKAIFQVITKDCV